MREPNKNYIYDLSDLTSDEKNQLLEKLIYLDDSWDGELPKEYLFSSKYLYFTNTYNYLGEWLVSDEIYRTTKEIVNAKELFYTLENVQVDCRELSEEHIENMCDVFIKNGYDYFNSKSYALKTGCECVFIQCDEDGLLIDSFSNGKTTITYEKFMELFERKEKNFKKLVEVLNEELTEKAYKETSNKLNYELDFNFITQLAERMAQNKHKYEPYNWQKLDNVDELKQALFRHVLEVMKGNYEDDNRLFGHLESIALNAMFINYQFNKNK